MSILNIRPAVRAGSKIVIGIAGQSGTGKTYTALQIARGMVSDSSKIGFLDTENRRGSLYADELDGQFMIGDLFYPFTPERYRKSIKEFQDAGVEVLIIDSVSHEWEQGCMEIAEAPLLRGKKMADWKKSKSEHKKFMSVLLQSDMHIICCIRAAEKMDFSNPKQPVSLGIQPLCEKNFMFELTASVMMFNEGLNQQHLKIPKDLKPIFGDGCNYLSIETGQQIMNWVNSGEQENPEIASWKNKLQLASVDGTDSLIECWKSVPKNLQKHLEHHKNNCKECALEVDKINSPSDVKLPEKAGVDIFDEGFEPPQIPQKDTSPGTKSEPVIQQKKQDSNEVF